MLSTLANSGSYSGMLPAWFVLPATAVVMLIVAAAITAAAKYTTPGSRRRIRIANGWVMLLTTPLAATGFTLIDSNTQPRLFFQIWILTIGLISISVTLAILDMVNTARLARLSHQQRRLSIRLTTTSADIHGANIEQEPAPLRFARDEQHTEGDRND